ncbi:quinon protein alcohol dehydrogenase-like superfamily, partial [Boletus edulis]
MSSSISQWSGNELGENSPSSGNAHQIEAKSIEINGRDDVWAIASLAEGRYIVSGGNEGKIRQWRVEDGMEVGTPMDAKGTVRCVAVSRDGKWIVSRTTNGSEVAVWDAASHEKVTEFREHSDWVRAVDVSPDATRIASGSDDRTVCIWSLFTGERLLYPLQHDEWVTTVKFSPDGRLIATATWWCDASLHIYDSQTGRHLVDSRIRVSSSGDPTGPGRGGTSIYIRAAI